MRAWTLSRQADQDVRRAIRRIARDNRTAGRDMGVQVERAAEMLAKRPLLGTIRADLAPERYRFWSLRRYPYILVYRLGTTPLRIVRVVHTARDLGAVLGDLDD